MRKIKINNNVFIPMPMTIVGSMNEGKPNFMAVGWITRVNFNPPMLAIGIGQGHLTHNCIVKNKAFSVNIPRKSELAKTDYTGLVSGTKVDKSEVFGVYYEQNTNIPLIKEAALSLECKLVETIKLPTNTIFVGEIFGAYCESEFLDGDKPDYKKMESYFLTMPDNIYWGFGENLGNAWEVGNRYKK